MSYTDPDDNPTPNKHKNVILCAVGAIALFSIGIGVGKRDERPSVAPDTKFAEEYVAADLGEAARIAGEQAAIAADAARVAAEQAMAGSTGTSEYPRAEDQAVVDKIIASCKEAAAYVADGDIQNAAIAIASTREEGNLFMKIDGFPKPVGFQEAGMGVMGAQGALLVAQGKVAGVNKIEAVAMFAQGVATCAA